MTGFVVLAVTLAAGTLAGFLLKARAGTFRGKDGAMDLGEPLGERATLVQFSSAFCQPCRATRRVLADVAAMVPGVRHVEIDAESRLDLVRAHDVMKTPTVFVLDRSGNIVKRASGQPRKADVIAALALAVDNPSQ